MSGPAPAQAATTAPRVVYVADSEMGKGGAPKAAPASAGAPTASAEQAQAATAPGAPADGTPHDATGARQARGGAGLLGRLLGLLPVASGVMQAAVGFLITRGTISLAGIPFLGSLPAFLVGSLVAATAMPTVVQGIGKLMGKTPPQPPPQPPR